MSSSDLVQIRDPFIKEWLQKKQAEYLEQGMRKSYREIILSLIMEKETAKYRKLANLAETKATFRNFDAETAKAFLKLRKKLLKKEISPEQVTVEALISQGLLEEQAVKIINKLQEEGII